MVLEGDRVSLAASKPLYQGGYAPREAELQVLMKVRAEVVAVEAVEDLEGLSPG